VALELGPHSRPERMQGDRAHPTRERNRTHRVPHAHTSPGHPNSAPRGANPISWRLARSRAGTREVLPVVAYRAGAIPDLALTILAEHGYILPLTTVGGVNDLAPTHPLKLRHINVRTRSLHAVLRGQLMPRSVRPSTHAPPSRAS